MWMSEFVVIVAIMTTQILQPREKIVQSGAANLSTQELLTTILGSGSKKVPVHVLAQKVEAKFPHHQELTLTELRQIKGIGLAKACQILAVFELLERLRPLGTPILDSIDKVLQQVVELRYSPREQVMCLYLNTRLQLLMKETLAIGAINQAALSPRDIFSAIKFFPITSIILVHNHPSGDASPSPEDLLFTKQVSDAGRLIGIELLDHLIVGQNKHYSYKAHFMI